MALLDETEVSTLLGRPLTTVETTNFDTYIDIAEQNVADLLCIPLEVQATNAEASERVFTRRGEFSTVFTPIFTDVTSVEVEDTTTTDFTKSFWDNRNADFYNSIIFTECLSKSQTEVKITAKWGFTTMPNDLARLIAQAFTVVSSAYQTKDVKSKKIEDFTITYGDMTSDDVLATSNARVIRKYSLCSMVDVTSTDSRHWRR